MTERLEAGGNADAFEQLMHAHERQVLGTALHMLGRLEDAQDAAQEVFVRLHRNMRKLDSADAVRRWLYRVTVNVCRDMLRKRHDTSALVEMAAPEAGPERLAEEAQRSRAVAQALRQLPEKERAALVLREIEGLSTREVAEILGSSEVTVRSQICSARMKLRRLTQEFLGKKV